MTGKNKGEWSELYVLLRLLEYGKIYAADSELKPLDGVYFPIIKIIREYKPEKTKVEYCNLNDEEVEILLDDVSLKKIGKDTLKEEADYLYEQICSSKSRSFKIIHTEQFMEEIECYKVTASSEKKTDIKMQIHDINTGYNPICGFSIKSELGNYSSLLNASGATNFIFEVTGVSDEQMDEINRINTVSKIQDRMKSIFSIGALTFCRTKNKAFENNLMLIDSKMPELIGELLLYSYRENVIDCKELIESLTALNPLSYPADHFYSYKFKKFLCSVALGMMPSRQWDGYDEANGGYIVVAPNGDVLAYYLYNRNYFEQYLLDHTKLERGSTSRHNFAELYKEKDRMYINLNLQIRFKKL